MRDRPHIKVAASIAAAVALVAGCGQSEPTDAGASPAAAATTQASAPAESPPAEPSPAEPVVEPPADEPAAEATDHRVTYNWAAPSELVTIEHQAGARTPYLVAIYAGDHSDDELPYQRLAFYFRE
jgi:type IV pilus biogenesis protein CpaD/CtpE